MLHIQLGGGAVAKNMYGGGSQTNANGLWFEQETDLAGALLAVDGYSVHGNDICFEGRRVGVSAPKHDLYRVLLKPRGIDHAKLVSKRLLPDEAIHLLDCDTVFIIEKKFQSSPGSVDEKLQTCHFKKLQYSKLFRSTGLDVEYMYVLNDWFKQACYQDVLEYVIECGCHYHFNEIPLSALGLPQRS